MRIVVKNASDNTNADVEVRSKWVELSNKHNIPIRCVHLITPSEICIHNDIVRGLNDNVGKSYSEQPFTLKDAHLAIII